MEPTEINGFDWDDEDDDPSNVRKIKVGHNVNVWEVEQVFSNGDYIWYQERGNEANEYNIIGRTRSGRLLRIHGCIYENPPKNGW